MRTNYLLTATLIAAVTGASAAYADPQMTLPQLSNPNPVKAETVKFEPFNGQVGGAHFAGGKIHTASREAPLLTGRSAYRDTNGHNGSHTRLQAGTRFGRDSGYVPLVDSHASGYGFYALQERYRAGADRYRWNHPYRGAVGYWPYGNPVQQAVDADRLRYSTWTPPTSGVNGYHYGVFDPVEGVGTPFFAGYYSAGTRDAEDGPEPLLGNPLN